MLRHTKKTESTAIDMTSGPILGQLVAFALPLMLGNVFQMLYNTVDSIVVGKYVSADALAAVGSTSTISMLLVGIMAGFPTGASVVAAQFLGAGQKEKIKPTISTTFWFLVVFSVILMAVGIFLSGNIMHWVNVPENIYADTVTYFRIYIMGLLFMALYNFFAAFLRSVGDSRTPLIFLIISFMHLYEAKVFLIRMLQAKQEQAASLSSWNPQPMTKPKSLSSAQIMTFWIRKQISAWAHTILQT